MVIALLVSREPIDGIDEYKSLAKILFKPENNENRPTYFMNKNKVDDALTGPDRRRNPRTNEYRGGEVLKRTKTNTIVYSDFPSVV